MKARTFLLFLFCFILNTSLFSQAEGDYMSSFSGDWSDPNIWSRFTGGTWSLPPNTPPTASTANEIKILDDRTVTVTTYIIADQLIVYGILDIQSSGTLDIQNGTGDDLQVYDTLRNGGGSVFISTIGTNVIKTGGVYQHNHTTTAGHIPTFTWEDSSNCEIIGYTTYTGNMSIDLQTFWNVTWDCENQTQNIVLHPNFSGMQGDFNVVSTGSGYLHLHDGYGMEYVVKGIFRQIGGEISLGAYMLSDSLRIEGDAEFLRGTFRAAFLSNPARIRFAGTTPRFITVEDDYYFYSGGINQGFVFLEVIPGSVLNMLTSVDMDNASMDLYGILICNEHLLRGNTFTMQTGSGLYIGSTYGIWTDDIGPGPGNIVTDTRVYESDATYFYCHPTSQISGDALPDQVTNLGKIKGGKVTLNKSVLVTDTVSLLEGIIELTNGYDLTLDYGAVMKGSFSNQNMILIDSTNSQLIYRVNQLGGYGFPVGTFTSGNYVYSPAKVDILSGKFEGKIPYIGITLDDERDNINFKGVHYLHRYWDLYHSAITGLIFSANFYYDDIDIHGDEEKIHVGVRHAYPYVTWVQWTDLVDAKNNVVPISSIGPVLALNNPIGFTGLNYEEGVILELKVFLQGAYR